MLSKSQILLKDPKPQTFVIEANTITITPTDSSVTIKVENSTAKTCYFIDIDNGIAAAISNENLKPHDISFERGLRFWG